ncbi:hypothetical protein GCM10023350_36780 [Nocardioides endophyticus]|uniref:YtxH domain-containing protein n=1 Tax=Nocardioides endophyticus TaxID=1353775 RepID=A0ABP8Z755_9ACTN
MTNDVDQVPLVVLGTLGGIAALLFPRAEIDPQRDKLRPSRSQANPQWSGL